MKPELNISLMSHCPVCGIGLDIESLATIVLSTPRGNRTWTRCPECKSFFDLERYDPEQEVGHTRTRPWGILESGVALNDYKAPMFEAILRVLRNYAQQGSTLLDIGCSYGGFLLRAKEEGYQVRGMDIVPEDVEYVRRQGIACDCAKSLDDLDIPKNSQGIISVLDCNYYWPSQIKELRAIHSLLRHGGLLVMRTVDTSWAVQIGLWLHRSFPRTGQRLCEKAVYDHRVSIPVRSLLGIMRQEGFEILYTSPRDAMPFRHNSLKVKTAYAIGYFVWRIAGWHLAPGWVLLVRKGVA